MSLNERKDKTGRIKEVALGLSAEEEKVLAECVAAVAGDAELSDMRDATWARYLRNNSWVVAPAIEQMRVYLAWRKEKDIDHILDVEAFPSRDIIRNIVPYAYHNCDKEGRPLYIEKTGAIATAAIADPAICDPDHFMHSHIYGVELMQKLMHDQSLLRGERVNGITTILDMTGLGFHHRQCLYVLKKALDFDKKYYPEYLGRLYVINSPWVTPYLFQAVQMFLDEVTKARIHMVPGNPAEFLLQHIDAENLPAEYGGKCTGVTCKHGGMGANYAPVKGCLDELDTSNLKASVVSGLEEELVSYDFEKLVASSSGGDNETFTWYWEEKDGMDIDFSVELLPVSGKRESDASRKVLVHKVERCKLSKGSFKAPYPNAQLLFRWDNNFSWMAKKNIRYTVHCINDDSGKMDSMLKHSSEKPAPAAAAAQQ